MLNNTTNTKHKKDMLAKCWAMTEKPQKLALETLHKSSLMAQQLHLSKRVNSMDGNNLIG